MNFDVSEKDMTILGVKFDNYEDFKAVWYVAGSAKFESFEPDKKFIETLKKHSQEKRLELANA
ncbi:hypothetical protein [Lactococcus termiticola]|uniref:hypothetical protein n=1 Tax=Lactococcus termiticola TaxID=2169526 RepID=UPI000D6596BB|nr:hypothetical protein [Lactococcus termiticola]